MSPYLSADDVASRMARHLRLTNLKLTGAAERVLAATGLFTNEEICAHVQQAKKYEELRRGAMVSSVARCRGAEPCGEILFD